MTKLSWAVTAGDQEPESQDDQECGNHFIDKDLECHEGDAHRPTPGKNPYWQGGRKGPEDKTKTPERKEGEKNQPAHKRDRMERTKQNLSRYMTLLDRGHTPESLGREEVNHFADLWEDAYGRDIDDQGVHDLSEKVTRKVAEWGSKDAQEQGFHDPTAPIGDQGSKGRHLYKQEKDPNARKTQMPRDGGGMEYTPDGTGGPEDGGLYDLYKDILKDRTGDGGGDEQWMEEDEHLNQPESLGPRQDDYFEPSQEMKDEQGLMDDAEKWAGPDYQGTEDAGPAPEKKKSKGPASGDEIGPYEYQDRQVDEWDPDASEEETDEYRRGERTRQVKKDYKRKRDAGKAKAPKAKSKKKAAKKAPAKKKAAKKKAAKKAPAKKKAAKKKAKSSLAHRLIWANPMDVAEGRPCGDGEDPKKGKCNDGTSPPPKQQKPAQQRPTGPAGKVNKDYRMSDRIKGPAQEGIGLQPGQDAGREARMAQHVDFLSQDDGTDPKQTTNLMRNMMGGAAPEPQPDGTSLVGSPVVTPQEAKQQNDDFRDTLTKTGWEPYSEVGKMSVWTKGNTAVSLEHKSNGNQMKIKDRRRPQAAPQRGRR